MSKEPSALGTLIYLLIISVIFAPIFIFKKPLWALIIILFWIVFFALVLAYDRRHWGRPGPDTLGVRLSSQTRKLDIGEYSVEGLVMGSCVRSP